MVCVPADSGWAVVVMKVATPLPLTFTVANTVLPSRKVTEPVFTVAVEGDRAVTVAVKVSTLPYVNAALGVDADVIVRLVAVLAAFTACVKDPLLLLKKTLSL